MASLLDLLGKAITTGTKVGGGLAGAGVGGLLALIMNEYDREPYISPLEAQDPDKVVLDTLPTDHLQIHDYPPVPQNAAPPTRSAGPPVQQPVQPPVPPPAEPYNYVRPDIDPLSDDAPVQPIFDLTSDDLKSDDVPIFDNSATEPEYAKPTTKEDLLALLFSPSKARAGVKSNKEFGMKYAETKPILQDLIRRQKGGSRPIEQYGNVAIDKYMQGLLGRYT